MWYTIGLTTCGSSCRSGILQNGGASQLHQTSVVTWQVLRVWPRGRRFIITRESHAGKELLPKAYWYECWFLEGSQVSEYNATWIWHCNLYTLCAGTFFPPMRMILFWQVLKEKMKRMIKKRNQNRSKAHLAFQHQTLTTRKKHQQHQHSLE